MDLSRLKLYPWCWFKYRKRDLTDSQKNPYPGWRQNEVRAHFGRYERKICPRSSSISLYDPPKQYTSGLYSIWHHEPHFCRVHLLGVPRANFLLTLTQL